MSLALSTSELASGASKFNYCPVAATESTDSQQPDCFGIEVSLGCDGTLVSLELIVAGLSILARLDILKFILQRTPNNTRLPSFVHLFSVQAGLGEIVLSPFVSKFHIILLHTYHFLVTSSLYHHGFNNFDDIPPVSRFLRSENHHIR